MIFNSLFGRCRIMLSHYIDIFYNKYYPPQIINQKRYQQKLTNKNFSLLTANCIGGYLYHQCGLEFKSPTINMMILNQDFKKFILNLKHYIDLTPIPYVDNRFPNVPSALLGDIVLHFTHYNSCKLGIDAWESRKKRINYENIYIIISDIDLSDSDIHNLKEVNCKKIVVMTSKDYGLQHCLYIPEFKGLEHVGDLLGKTISGKWKFEKYFDFVGWVNSDNPKAQDFYIGKYK